MAVVSSFNEIWSGRKHSQDEKALRRYTRVFRAVTDDILTGPREVREYVDCPRIGDIYTSIDSLETDFGAFCVLVDIDQDSDNPRVWLVRCEYSSNAIDQSRQDENPLNRPADIRWGSQKFQRIVIRDLLNGRSVVNSARQRYDPPVEADDSRPTLTVSRNESTFDESLAITYQDAVNTDTFFGFDPYTAKVESITADRQDENGVTFWKVTYEFHFRREGWLAYVLDTGTFKLVNDKPVKFIDHYGQPASEPILLNGDGKPLFEAKTTLTPTGVFDWETTLDVASTSNFRQSASAADPPWYIRCDDELMQVTNVGAGVFTVKRGQLGTTAAGHAVDAVVYQEPFYYQYHIYKELPFGPLGLP